MNFLAHLFLSGEDEGIQFGNFIGDAVKGKNFDGFPPRIVYGIIMHRAIDEFTDKHPVFIRSKRRLQPNYRLYSGIIVDIFYDHFLARNWNDYSDTDLNTYVSATYNMLIRNYKHLPKHSKRLLPFMITQNWLVGYSNLYSLQRVFNGMARRTGYKSGMENAISDLKLDYSSYENEFREFFPDLESFTLKYMAASAQSV